MSIPSYDEFFPYLLKAIEKEHPIKISKLREKIATLAQITEEQQKELLPSKTETVFKNRIHWAAFYLKKAGLIENPTRGIYSLSIRGESWIKQRGYEITLNDLNQFEEFVESMKPREKSDKVKVVEKKQEVYQETTPEARIEAAMDLLHKQLSDELLEEIMAMTPQFFERLVLDLLYSLGYGGKRENSIVMTSYSQDEGIDGLIKEDELGLDHVYIQAKRWKNTVGRPEVQQFAGALSGQGARKGVFITTSNFSKQATQFADKQLNTKIVLVDGESLTDLMISYGVGLATERQYKIQKIDRDYFIEED